MKIPQQFTLAEVQQSFQDVQRILRPIESPSWDLSGRRIGKVGKAIDAFDAATKFDVEKWIGELEARLKGTSADSTPNTALWITSSVRVGTVATRGSAVAHANSLFIATDQGYIGWISTGSIWRYAFGIERNSLANIRSGLGADDVGYLFEVTDYSHVLYWGGGAWQWAPGEKGAGFYQLFEAAPSGYGSLAWQICDGSTVARLNADGTTSNVTLDNLGTAAYLKGGTSSAAVAAAGGLTASVSGGTPAGTVSQPTFTGNPVAAASTQATPDLVAPDTAGTGVSPVTTATGTVSQPTFAGSALAGHDHGPNTLELRNKQARLYYRR